MKLSKKTNAEISKYSVALSFGAVIFAAVGWLGTDIWLAATQWLLVALVLLAVGIYFKME